MTKETWSKYLTIFISILAATVLAVVFAFFILQGKSLQNPKVLYLLIFLIPLAFWGYYLKSYYVPSIKYPIAQKVKIPLTFSAILARFLALTLTIIALFLGILSLSRPRLEGKSIIPPTKGVDIMITLDVSGSMSTPDFVPSRMEVAKETAANFIKERSSDRIGIVVFSGAAMLQCPLTLDYFALDEYMNLVYVDMINGATGTAIGDAIAISTQHLKDGLAKSKVIILITDGENNSGIIDPIAAAKAAEAFGIKIYTILIAADLASIPVNSNFRDQLIESYKANAALMENAISSLKEISAITGGVSYRATNALELADIYNQINALEKTDFKETISLNYEDAYQKILLFSLLFLVLAFLIEKFIFIKIP